MPDDYIPSLKKLSFSGRKESGGGGGGGGVETIGGVLRSSNITLNALHSFHPSLPGTQAASILITVFFTIRLGTHGYDNYVSFSFVATYR